MDAGESREGEGEEPEALAYDEGDKA